MLLLFGPTRSGKITLRALDGYKDMQEVNRAAQATSLMPDADELTFSTT